MAFFLPFLRTYLFHLLLYSIFDSIKCKIYFCYFDNWAFIYCFRSSSSSLSSINRVRIKYKKGSNPCGFVILIFFHLWSLFPTFFYSGGYESWFSLDGYKSWFSLNIIHREMVECIFERFKFPKLEMHPQPCVTGWFYTTLNPVQR